MALKQKVLLGFIVIAFILFLSGLTSVFELGRMRNSVSRLLSNNVSNINSSRLLLEVTDEQIFHLLSQIGLDEEQSLDITPIYGDERFDSFMQDNRRSFATAEEHAVSDTIMYAYASYMQVMHDAPSIWSNSSTEDRRQWYANTLNPAYQKLRHYIRKLIILEQDYLRLHTEEIQSGFYRGIMPGIIAVGTGILLVFLFYYFINLYLLSPILKMRIGLQSYLSFKRPYQVSLDTDDELTDFNDALYKLTESHRIITKAQSREDL